MVNRHLVTGNQRYMAEYDPKVLRAIEEGYTFYGKTRRPSPEEIPLGEALSTNRKIKKTKAAFEMEMQPLSGSVGVPLVQPVQRVMETNFFVRQEEDAVYPRGAMSKSHCCLFSKKPAADKYSSSNLESGSETDEYFSCDGQ